MGWSSYWSCNRGRSEEEKISLRNKKPEINNFKEDELMKTLVKVLAVVWCVSFILPIRIEFAVNANSIESEEESEEA